MNSITELLDLEDADIFISDISISGTQKILTIETRPETHFCPICGFKMHSRGLKTRTINHPVLQDTYELVLKLKQRRWRCTNPQCSYTTNETFNFVNKRRRNTNATDMLIIKAFRDLSISASSVAAKFNVWNTFHPYQEFPPDSFASFCLPVIEMEYTVPNPSLHEVHTVLLL